jgi:hypothetical protein
LLRVLELRNVGTLAAGILMVAPVCGLRPLRALRLPTQKLPKLSRDYHAASLQRAFQGGFEGVQNRLGGIRGLAGADFRNQLAFAE